MKSANNFAVCEFLSFKAPSSEMIQWSAAFIWPTVDGWSSKVESPTSATCRDDIFNGSQWMTREGEGFINSSSYAY